MNLIVLLKFLQEQQLSEKLKSETALLFMMQNLEIQAYFFVSRVYS